MLSQLRQLQVIINGVEAERTKEWYYGKYFTGTINLNFAGDSYTMFFVEGSMAEVRSGVPVEGFDFGLAGTEEQWKDFFQHGIFGYATAPAYQNPFGLTVTGSVMRFRQHYNICAHVCKELAKIVRKEGKEV